MQRVKSGLLMMMLSPFVFAEGNILEGDYAGGTMRFRGQIFAETCRVVSESQQLTIHMGTISSNRFHSLGDDANPVPFDIHLRDCDAIVSKHIGIAFKGVADSKNPDVLSVGEGPDVATGIGVVIFNEANKLIPLNGDASNWKRINSGPIAFHLVAKYRATSRQVTGGVANAQAWFSLTYQ
ncbi:TPA: fimbrial protein [Klebsiella quasipneumoniae subsp. similipneumoniae]